MRRRVYWPVVLLVAAVVLLLDGSVLTHAQERETGSPKRYATWQASHPFTLGAMSYDMA